MTQTYTIHPAVPVMRAVITLFATDLQDAVRNLHGTCFEIDGEESTYWADAGEMIDHLSDNDVTAQISAPRAVTLLEMVKYAYGQGVEVIHFHLI